MTLFIFGKQKKEIKKKTSSKKSTKKKIPIKKTNLKISKSDNSTANGRETLNIGGTVEENQFPQKEIIAHLIGTTLTSNSKQAYAYCKQSSFGEHIEDKIKYTLSEGLFLVQNEKMDIYQNNKLLTAEELIQKFTKADKKFPVKYAVFKDLRVKGYVIKTALKFGAEFRAYEKGKKPGKEHSKWIIFTDNENNKTTWHEFAAKNRVAHSTNKNVLLAIVDEEGQITYYEIKWTKP
jgi:tRNA-intron endonuclease